MRRQWVWAHLYSQEWETDSHMIFEANPNWINPPQAGAGLHPHGR